MKKNKISRLMKGGIGAIALTLFCLAGCTSSFSPDSKKSGGKGETDISQIEAEFVSPVNEDNKLIVYTSHKQEVYAPIVEEFEENTGIFVEIHTGGTQEILREISQGARCDVVFGGGVESYEVHKEYFAPYICSQADAISTEMISEDNTWTPFTELPLVFIYNNKLVAKEDAPTGWEEFLTDKWRGEIAFASPFTSGTSVTIMSAFVQHLSISPNELAEKLYSSLNGEILSDSAEVAESVGQGVNLVGITLESSARAAIARGSDISMVYPGEGTCNVPDGCAILKTAEHRENAEAFLDFTISVEVQDFAARELNRRPVRDDMSYTGDFPELTTFHFDISRSAKETDEILNQWSRITEGAE